MFSESSDDVLIYSKVEKYVDSCSVKQPSPPLAKVFLLGYFGGFPLISSSLLECPINSKLYYNPSCHLQDFGYTNTFCSEMGHES